ncbi:MAG: recombination mediator RecR [Puniceicoccales bacterium]|jgi:recombination protein RecR|nr:recombination mediator RecR [Puniceicoccales bacterium]
MTAAFDHVRQLLKQLPGLGLRSAERIALHLLAERPERLGPLLDALRSAASALRRCPRCGNLCEGELCAICADPRRDTRRLCVVERIPDLLALERAGAHDGRYHVLHGKLSPIQGVGPEHLNFAGLAERLDEEGVGEVILALSNDIEGEATCHYIRETFLTARPAVAASRIGFGIPSGGALTYADPATLKNAIDARRHWDTAGGAC